MASASPPSQAGPPQEITYLTPEEVSARFRGRVAVRTLSNWRCLGTGPKYCKIGGRILYPLHEIEAWEAGRTAVSTAGYVKAAIAGVIFLANTNSAKTAMLLAGMVA